MVSLDNLYAAILDTHDTANIFAEVLGELEWFRENFDLMLEMNDKTEIADHVVKLLGEYAYG